MDQQLIMQLQMLHQQTQQMEEQLKLVDEQIVELETFRVGLRALDESEEKEMLASLGKGVFIKTDIKDKKLFVDVGKGYLVRKTTDEALKVVIEQTRRLGEMKMQINAQIETATDELKEKMKVLEAQEPQA